MCAVFLYPLLPRPGGYEGRKEGFYTMAIISNTNYTNTSGSPIIIGVDNGYGVRP